MQDYIVDGAPIAGRFVINCAGSSVWVGPDELERRYARHWAQRAEAFDEPINCGSVKEA